jgi:Retrotransposon gag protein/Zinc knuckle
MEQIQQQPLGSTVGMSTTPTAYTHITLTDSTIQLGCGGSGGELVPGHPAASIEYGELSGNPPAIFDGERTHSEAFFLQFTLFRRINANHHLMVVPFDRALLALSYIQGPKVDRWMEERFEELVHLTNTGTKLTDEALWENFEQKFWTAFADTYKKERAEIALLRHQMKGDDLETYVSTFEHLRREAGWGRDEPGTIVLFREGLKHHLHKAIIERACQMPVTMDDWQSAARTEQAMSIEWKNVMMYNSQGGKRKQGRRPSMDTGVTETRPRLGEERKRLIAEGRCFFCKAKGHISRQCPKKT